MINECKDSSGKEKNIICLYMHLISVKRKSKHVSNPAGQKEKTNYDKKMHLSREVRDAEAMLYHISKPF